MATGTITAVRPDRGFGFIRPDDGTEDLFFHITQTGWDDSSFDARLVRLNVTFDVGTDERNGRTRAVNVRPRDR
jgi:CspA family cold shock protein